jgi:hypothetical protein
MNPLEQTYLQLMWFLMLDYCLFTIIYVYLCLLTIVGKRYLLSCLRGPVQTVMYFQFGRSVM